LKRLLIITALIAVATTGAAAWAFSAWLNEPLPSTDETLFEIDPGSAFTTVSNRLAGAGIIEHPRLLSLYARVTGAAQRVHAGEYLITPGETPRGLLAKFVAGEVMLYSFTVVEGWTFRELIDALAGNAAIAAVPTVEDWPALRQQLGIDHESPEGLFLPETYRFPKGTPAVELLGQAYAALENALAEAWQNRDGGLPLATPYEALTLASIIEKETALAAERPRIAGVFVRRLEQRMRLQTDPTVIFGLGDSFDGNLTRRHLRTDTPYNTYTRRGLPPGPIALPGRAAIEASVHPAPGDELYFVATGLGDGSHYFSVTREEHEAAVEEYLARQRGERAGQ